MSEKFRCVVATRARAEDFYAETATGRSLALFRTAPFIEVQLFAENRTGLPTLYNRAIEAARTDPANLVFIHDDVYLCDFFWASRLLDALAHFAIVGLAGNRRRVPRQPGWAFVDERLTWDAPENLSGLVGHGKGFPPANLSFYGTPGQEVKLLDGLLLAADSETLIRHELRFDERFAFHFYDLDFCREAEKRGLSMGTVPLSVIHESAGNFGGEAWRQGYQVYLDKWKD